MCKANFRTLVLAITRVQCPLCRYKVDDGDKFFSDLTVYLLRRFLQLDLSQTHYIRTECNVVSVLAVRTYEGVELWLDSFLSSALDIVEYSAPRPGRFTPTKFYTVAHSIGGSVGSSADRRVPERRKVSFSCRGSKHVPSVVQPVSSSLLHLQSLHATS